MDDQSFFWPEVIKYGLPIPVIRQGKPDHRILLAFGYDEKLDSLCDYRIVFLVAGYRGKNFHLDRIEHDICKKLSHYSGFACKKHPGYSLVDYSEVDYSDIDTYCSKYPLEVSFLGNLDSLDKKMFICNQSGGIIHPKYIFDKEPYIIFTYKLYHPEPEDAPNRYENMSELLIETYRNPNKIIIPKTEEEMFEFIEHFLKTEYQDV